MTFSREEGILAEQKISPLQMNGVDLKLRFALNVWPFFQLMAWSIATESSRRRHQVTQVTHGVRERKKERERERERVVDIVAKVPIDRDCSSWHRQSLGKQDERSHCGHSIVRQGHGKSYKSLCALASERETCSYPFFSIRHVTSCHSSILSHVTERERERERVEQKEC